MQYGFGVLATTLQFAAQQIGIVNLPLFNPQGRKLETERESYYTEHTETARSGA